MLIVRKIEKEEKFQMKEKERRKIEKSNKNEKKI